MMQRVLVGSGEVYEVTGTSTAGEPIAGGARLQIDADRIAQEFLDAGAVDVHIDVTKTKRYLVTQ